MKKKLIAALAVCLVMVLTGCAYTEADKVNYNMSKQAQYFECERP